MIHKERICELNKKEPADNPYIIYWMQNAQRTEYNHALEYAIRLANRNKKPLLVYFGLTDNYPDANLRHYQFMIEGLKDVRVSLMKRNIKFLVIKTSPEKGALDISSYASVIIVEKGYTRIEKSWREYLATNAECSVISIETNITVPVETASYKEEYSAATFRVKINKSLPDFDKSLEEKSILVSSLDITLPFDDISNDMDTFLSSTNACVKPSVTFKGGTEQAKKRLDHFLSNMISDYGRLRNDPGLGYTSNLSPYLHFGQISPIYILQKLNTNAEEFVDELIVRRELSFNFVYYNEFYDTYRSIPEWARITLEKHRTDNREYLYSTEDLETASTHDIYWNAAQREMLMTGKMHGYMRMYWGKKILQWCADPQSAYETALYLNNKYCLDGRDANSYCAIAWCFGKHDRPWKERDIFGTVRYMNDKGLERKFDINRYVVMVDSLQRQL